METLESVEKNNGVQCEMLIKLQDLVWKKYDGYIQSTMLSKNEGNGDELLVSFIDACGRDCSVEISEYNTVHYGFLWGDEDDLHVVSLTEWLEYMDSLPKSFKTYCKNMINHQ